MIISNLSNASQQKLLKIGFQLTDDINHVGDGHGGALTGFYLDAPIHYAAKYTTSLDSTKTLEYFEEKVDGSHERFGYNVKDILSEKNSFWPATFFWTQIQKHALGKQVDYSGTESLVDDAPTLK